MHQEDTYRSRGVSSCFFGFAERANWEVGFQGRFRVGMARKTDSTLFLNLTPK